MSVVSVHLPWRWGHRCDRPYAAGVGRGIPRRQGHRPPVAARTNPARQTAPSRSDPSQDAAGPDAPADTGAGGGAETNDGDDVGVVDAPEIKHPRRGTGRRTARIRRRNPNRALRHRPLPNRTPTSNSRATPVPPEVTETAAAEDPPVAVTPNPKAPACFGCRSRRSTRQRPAVRRSGADGVRAPESSLAEPLEVALAAPVATSLVTARSIAAVSEPPTATQESSVSITAVTPASVDKSHPWRSLVLGVLGFFGFDPTPVPAMTLC